MDAPLVDHAVRVALLVVHQWDRGVKQEEWVLESVHSEETLRPLDQSRGREEAMV